MLGLAWLGLRKKGLHISPRRPGTHGPVSDKRAIEQIRKIFPAGPLDQVLNLADATRDLTGKRIVRGLEGIEVNLTELPRFVAAYRIKMGLGERSLLDFGGRHSEVEAKPNTDRR